MQPKKNDPDKDPDGTGGGNSDGNQKGNQKIDENIKNLQRKLTEKDKSLQEALKKIEDFEKKSDTKKTELDKMGEVIQGLANEISELRREKKREELKKLFPDIHPDLLIDKTDEQIEKLAVEQRKIQKERFGDSKIFSQPEFSDSGEVEKAIEKIKADKQKSGLEKAVEIMRLNDIKNNLLK